jgi:hypothetical protein
MLLFLYFQDLTILLPETSLIEQRETESSPELVSNPDETELGTEMIITNEQQTKVEKEGTALKNPQSTPPPNKTDDSVSSDPWGKRRFWELCEKPRSQPRLSLVWNYFLVYEDRQDFPAAVCKTCYNQKKDNSSYTPLDWECSFTPANSIPKKLESHLRNFHPELFGRLAQDKKKISNDTEERRTWEICEKPMRWNNRSPIWNYFYIYKDHPEFQGVVCKTCYDKKKDTKALPNSWESVYGSGRAKPSNLAVHLQSVHPEVFEEYKNLSKSEIGWNSLKS